MALDLSLHPCFNKDTRHKTGRVHLPVAPKCNVQCNYCDRKYDCVNESRPGVTSVVLEPRQALAYLDEVVARMPQLKVVGIAGPGDPFASPDETLETMRLVREKYPEMLLCVSSNGLNLAPYAKDLAALQVSHVTVTLNAIDPAIAAKIYSWVRDRKLMYRGEQAAEILLQRQIESIKAVKAAGVTLKINTILIPGVNDDHVELVAEEMKALGADLMNCIPLLPVAGTPFGELEKLSVPEVRDIRTKVAAVIPQMEHCARCRADAVGLLGDDKSAELVTVMQAAANGQLDDRGGRPYVAVATMEGILINQHLGEADKFWIFEYDEIEPKLVAMREAPEPGDGNLRWRELAEMLTDCHTVLVSGVGRKPRWVMEQTGLRVMEASGLIASAMEALYRTGDLPAAMKKTFKSCSSSGCQGTGAGCA
ncbi:MAG: radical SAM protein [Acidobacteriota bacterium]|nr:radical SAM protein [Acidobacteriota bacterium]